jgi:Mg-chelatase subunit ChlI
MKNVIEARALFLVRLFLTISNTTSSLIVRTNDDRQADRLNVNDEHWERRAQKKNMDEDEDKEGKGKKKKKKKGEEEEEEEDDNDDDDGQEEGEEKERSVYVFACARSKYSIRVYCISSLILSVYVRHHLRLILC